MHSINGSLRLLPQPFLHHCHITPRPAPGHGHVDEFYRALQSVFHLQRAVDLTERPPAEKRRLFVTRDRVPDGDETSSEARRREVI